MKYVLRYKAVITTFIMALLIVVMGSNAEAITINRKVTKDQYNYYVGQETSVSGNGIKINGKKISKMKKKVKAVKTGYSDYYGSYQKGGYYQEENAYKSGKSKADGYKYYKGDYYTLRFLKAGTYKVSDVSYSNRFTVNWNSYPVFQMVETRSAIVGGKRQYYYKLQRIYDTKDGGYEYKDVGTEEYVYKTIDSSKDTSYYRNYSYYEGVKSKKIYANGDAGITAAKFKTGADGKKHLYYEAIVVKTTTVKPYKVVKETSIVKSVQLGKSKYSYSSGRSGYSINSVNVSKKFLSGKSGKVTVKMGDQYSLQSIVVVTYDKEGNQQLQLVKNKGKATYGAYKNQYSYKRETGTYAYARSSMYKETIVYVFYKNKNTGEYTKIKSITKDEDGYYKINYERCYWDGSKEEYTTSYVPSACRSDAYYFYKK